MAAPLKLDQPQALPLCAARRDRADRKGRCLRADRYRSRQQAGLVPQAYRRSARRRCFWLAITRSSSPPSSSNIWRRRRPVRCIRPMPCTAPSIAPSSSSARPCSTISPGSIRRWMKPHSRPRRRSSRRSLHVWRRESPGRGSTARNSRWSMRCSARLPLFRCVRRNRRFRDSGRQAEARALARKSRRAAFGQISGRRQIIRRLLRDFIDRRRSYLSQLQAKLAA